MYIYICMYVCVCVYIYIYTFCPLDRARTTIFDSSEIDDDLSFEQRETKSLSRERREKKRKKEIDREREIYSFDFPLCTLQLLEICSNRISFRVEHTQSHLSSSSDLE